MVLAALNTARDKGADAAVKSSLSTIRTQAELYYDNNANQYATAVSTNGAACVGNIGMFTDPTILAAIRGIMNNDGANDPDCDVSTTAWAVSVSLKGGGFMCADSTGYASVNSRTAVVYTAVNGAAGVGAKTGNGIVCN